MSISVLQIVLLAAGFAFLLGGAIFAVIGARIAAAGRAAQAEAGLRLAASQELAVEVKRLAERVEQSLAARDAALENAFLRHNDACMASVQSTLATHPAAGCTHGAGAAAELSGDHHDDDDDDDDDHKKHQGVDDVDRPSFLARLFRRYE